MSTWKKMDTCPVGKPVLFWWRPNDDDHFAEKVVIGSLVGPNYPEKSGIYWWNGQTGQYQDVWHLLYWMELPNRPHDRQAAYEAAIENWKSMPKEMR